MTQNSLELSIELSALMLNKTVLNHSVSMDTNEHIYKATYIHVHVYATSTHHSLSFLA